MKKTLVSLILAFFLFSLCLTSVSAATVEYWYPENQPDFQDFHGENLPRVVDNAEILTDEQESELSAEVQYIVDRYNIGYVIFTDDDNHGLSKEVYSADFLYYNGYGVGDTYDAVVFYLSLEEGNRGWRTTSIGNCENIFNSTVTYTIDELVDYDIRTNRDYYTAFKKHIAFVDSLMSNLSDTPDWYPEGTLTYNLDREDAGRGENLDLSKPRVIDNGGYFTDKEKSELSEKLKEYSKSLNCDLILFTDKKCHAPTPYIYAGDYYYYNDYYKDGAVIYLINDEYLGGYYYNVCGFGKAYDKISNIDIADYLYKKDLKTPYDLSNECIKTVKYVISHNRLPLPTKKILLCILIGYVIGLIISLIYVSTLKRKMRFVSPVDAKEYLVDGSYIVHDKSVDYLYTTVTKVAKPQDNDRSGGGSSFSSGSSSSGGSFSSGGRDF